MPTRNCERAYYMDMDGHPIGLYRERDRHTESQTETQRQTDIDRQTETDRERQTDTDRQTQTDRQSDSGLRLKQHLRYDCVVNFKQTCHQSDFSGSLA